MTTFTAYKWIYDEHPLNMEIIFNFMKLYASCQSCHKKDIGDWLGWPWKGIRRVVNTDIDGKLKIDNIDNKQQHQWQCFERDLSGFQYHECN